MILSDPLAFRSIYLTAITNRCHKCANSIWEFADDHNMIHFVFTCPQNVVLMYIWGLCAIADCRPPLSPLYLTCISVMQHFAVLVFYPRMAENLLLHSVVKTCFVVQALLFTEEY